MKIASFNINGIKARLPALLEWLKESKPDIVALQEIKSLDETFPKLELESLGYNIIINGQKSFNGVAILSKFPIGYYTSGLTFNQHDDQARWIEAEIEGVKICCLYLPNGNPLPGPKYDYKLNWMEAFFKHAENLINSEEAVIMLGDYNVIPQKEDAENPEYWEADALFDLKVRSLFQKILNLGFTDALRVTNQNNGAYTFWDYQGSAWRRNNGIRIDHILLSPAAADLLIECSIDNYIRGREKPSDHVPIWVKLKS